jgi:hypothetical protein
LVAIESRDPIAWPEPAAGDFKVAGIMVSGIAGLSEEAGQRSDGRQSNYVKFSCKRR